MDARENWNVFYVKFLYLAHTISSETEYVLFIFSIVYNITDYGLSFLIYNNKKWNQLMIFQFDINAIWQQPLYQHSAEGWQQRKN